MHTYAVSPDNRRRAQFFVTIASLICAWGLHEALNAAAWTSLWWVDVPSFLGFYGLLWKLHDRFGWNSRCSRVFGLASVDLSGEWEGTIMSSYDESGSKTNARVRIRQTSTHMEMLLSTAYSDSSTQGAIVDMSGASVRFMYFFESRPRSGTPDTMHAHSGAGLLELRDDCLVGEYFTGRDRITNGRLELLRKTRVGRKVASKV